MVHQRRNKLSGLLLVLQLIALLVVGDENRVQEHQKNATSERRDKVFSLFSVVQFKNSECRSLSSMAGGQSNVRNGTCYTASECSNRGGTASGNCAAGFGVCCLFLVTNSGSSINQNCTYVRNPGFPNAYSTTGSLTYTVTKSSSDVCFLRLDFESFTIIGPSNSSEINGGACQDAFKINTNSGQTVPTICGLNSGQHIYVDMGNTPTDVATLAFTFASSTSTTRMWEIKVSQIECSNPNRPPYGCLQNWTTMTGRITTFNWLSTSTGHLASQSYSACVRRASNYCCIQYQTCAGITSAFSLDTSITTGAIDTSCTRDFISIPASNTRCSATGSALISKYCGYYLGVATSLPICDCTSPFQILINTDATADGMSGLPPSTISRGLCLDYTQIPCLN